MTSHRQLMYRAGAALALLILAAPTIGAEAGRPVRVPAASDGLLPTEKIVEDVWVHSQFEQVKQPRARATVWFDEQFLGDGKAYRRRADEFKDAKRTELRTGVVRTLKALSDRSFQAAKDDLDRLVADGVISDVRRHWIVNGFSCSLAPSSVEELKKVKGVSKIFATQAAPANVSAGEAPVFPPVERTDFDPNRYQHPWYVRL